MPTWNDIRETADLRAEHNIRGMRSAAVQSQYSASPRLFALAGAFRAGLDPTSAVDIFYLKCFNILTAEGVSLDVWGRVLAISRTIEFRGVSIVLDDGYFRLLLLYKALANISSGDAETLNRLLSALAATGAGNLPGRAYVIETAPMVIRWVFEDWLSPQALAVFSAAGMLARPGGVGWEWYALRPDHCFGFDGSGLNPFDCRPFAPDDSFHSYTEEN
jgi:hypothetical protein